MCPAGKESVQPDRNSVFPRWTESFLVGQIALNCRLPLTFQNQYNYLKIGNNDVLLHAWHAFWYPL
jgi:hypothetical protein